MRSRRKLSAQSFGIKFVALGLTLLLVGCGSRVHFLSASTTKPDTISGTLYRPKGTGPFPAMVLLHTCVGLRPNIFDWAARLKGDGVVALVVDSHGSRGFGDLCARGWLVGVNDIVWDAFGALAYLRSLPFVDGDRIGVMGWSRGATAASKAGSEGLGKVAQPGAGGFRVAVAFYPACSGYIGSDTVPASDTVPLLLLVGEADDWTPPVMCEGAAEELRKEGRTVLWKVYPGAHHAFDNAELGNRTIRMLGHTLEYDPYATRDAKKRVRAFLNQYLRRVP